MYYRLATVVLGLPPYRTRGAARFKSLVPPACSMERSGYFVDLGSHNGLAVNRQLIFLLLLSRSYRVSTVVSYCYSLRCVLHLIKSYSYL